MYTIYFRLVVYEVLYTYDVIDNTDVGQIRSPLMIC